MAIVPTVDSDAHATLEIEFLFLDLTTCSRCLGADRSLASALTLVREVLEATGVEVEVTKVLVDSEPQARALRFVARRRFGSMAKMSRWNCGRSWCGTEACADGCGEQIACRVWVHRGQEYTEPPVAMIIDAILGVPALHRRGRAQPGAL